MTADKKPNPAPTATKPAPAAKKPAAIPNVAALKVTISGSYRNAEKEVIDFGPLVGIIPYLEEEVATQQVRKRYAAMWIINSGKYKERLKSVREVWLDKIEKIETPITSFSYIGKDIAEMSFEELQDLASANALQGIPLYKKTSLRQSQNIAYAEFALKVLKVKPASGSKIDVAKWKLLTDYRVEGFNLMKNPPIIVGGKTHQDESSKMTNDEIIAIEQSSKSSPKTTLTLEEMKAIAETKSIPYAPDISFDDLYAVLFSGS